MSDTTGNMSLSERTKHKPDYQLLVCVGIMVPFGLVMVYSASFVEGFVYYNDGLHYLMRQLFAAFVGTIGFLVTQRTHYRWWHNYALHLFVLSLMLLFVTGFVLPRSITEVNGSRSWIRLGFFSVQPSEFVKLTLIIYLASWLSRRGPRMANLLNGTIPFGVIVGLVTALVMVGKDLGSATIIVAVSALIYFVAGASLFHLFCAGLLGLVSFLVGINVAAYRLDRINAWLDPFAYYSGAGFQPLHALYALASGGIFGVGLGQSRQKYLWLPQSYTDTILAIIGEEMGLIGTLFVVGCFVFLAYRGFKIARRAPNTFGALLATGITLWLVVQAIVNLAVVTSLAPFTGITLPFLSYGGTSLMISMVSTGILLNISKYTLADDMSPGVLRLVYEQLRTFIAALSPFWRRDGGHVYPSLAVAAALVRLPNNPRVAYIGSPDGMEGDIVRVESNLPFWSIEAAAVRGRGFGALLKNSWRLLRGVVQAIALIQRTQPAAIFGTGGYVCVPLFVAAWVMGVPSAIYLPDVVPGLAVRFLSRLATVTLGSIPDAAAYLGMSATTAGDWLRGMRKLVVTGYPVRADILQVDRGTIRAILGITDDTPLILIYGGSRGARSLNQAVATMLPRVLAIAHVLHVCGREGDESLLQRQMADLPAELQARYHLYPYLATDGAVTMTAALVGADLTICRSGASVLGELPAAGLPAILVPYPYVHQDENADYLVRHGAAIKIADSAQRECLLPAIEGLLQDKTTLQQMRTAMQAVARPEAALTMATLLCDIARST